MTYMKHTLRQPKLKTLNSTGDFFDKGHKDLFFPAILFKLITGEGFSIANYFPVLANYYFWSLHFHMPRSNHEKQKDQFSLFAPSVVSERAI